MIQMAVKRAASARPDELSWADVPGAVPRSYFVHIYLASHFKERLPQRLGVCSPEA
jgi:hypothetical protein